MIPIVTPTRMAEIDAAAPLPVEELIDRAGRAVARAAVAMLGGVYGRRVVILAGPGNNGADGRVAAAHLARRGVRCRVIDVGEAAATLPPADLVIDAAFGTGLARPFTAPAVPAGTPVLAVDIPSGVDGLTGATRGAPLAADRTLTFVALKPGLVLEPGRTLAGVVEVVDIGLDAGVVQVHAITDADVGSLLGPRRADDHKWRSGVLIVGGAVGMTGAASLAARSAQRLGAGIVLLAMPGARGDEGPVEAVAHPLPALAWGDVAFGVVDERVRAVLVGPGLGVLDEATLAQAAQVGRPLVLDAGALQPWCVDAVAGRAESTVLTPHDGEWARIGGSPDPDKIGATREFAVTHGLTVLRKGPTSIVADPHGNVRVITSGSAALASAGTGDVLASGIVALLARGLDAFDAAAAAAHAHGRAGRALGSGLVASEVADQMRHEIDFLMERNR